MPRITSCSSAAWCTWARGGEPRPAKGDRLRSSQRPLSEGRRACTQVGMLFVRQGPVGRLSQVASVLVGLPTCQAPLWLPSTGLVASSDPGILPGIQAASRGRFDWADKLKLYLEHSGAWDQLMRNLIQWVRSTEPPLMDLWGGGPGICLLRCDSERGATAESLKTHTRSRTHSQIRRRFSCLSLPDTTIIIRRAPVYFPCCWLPSRTASYQLKW